VAIHLDHGGGDWRDTQGRCDVLVAGSAQAARSGVAEVLQSRSLSFASSRSSRRLAVLSGDRPAAPHPRHRAGFIAPIVRTDLIDEIVRSAPTPPSDDRATDRPHRGIRSHLVRRALAAALSGRATRDDGK